MSTIYIVVQLYTSKNYNFNTCVVILYCHSCKYLCNVIVICGHCVVHNCAMPIMLLPGVLHTLHKAAYIPTPLIQFANDTIYVQNRTIIALSILVDEVTMP